MADLPAGGYHTLDYSAQDGILTLTLDRPDQLNSFTLTMADELVHAFERADRDDGVAAVVVTGRGRAFCAGMDLSGDGKEGVAAFREKREPRFTGRTTAMPPFYPWQD